VSAVVLPSLSKNNIAVELTGVVKHFGSVVAVDGVDLQIASGDFVTLLGPSGCGKTTILRMIAGLEEPTAGDILIKGRRVNDIPIHQRNIGLVFQNYALFPHKTIYDNVAFGLKYRDVDKATRRDRVARTLDLVRLQGVEKRLPAQLSGGQQQRVALARAIVIEPDVLLLDEPLSALDANLREDMRIELKKIQRELDITTIFVTHDQEEALAMSDRVVVMSDGEKVQEGAPEDVYNRPASRFVADFLGYSNFIPGTVDGIDGGIVTVNLGDGHALKVLRVGDWTLGSPVQVVVRAEKIQIDHDASSNDSSTLLDGTVADVDYLGVTARYFIEVAGRRIQVISTIEDHPYREGDKVQLHIRPRDCLLLDETGKVYS
jgi:putative spermidine/putrescine transport system ATP-binding protein/spermidine/putrescine transport system ATP-binding protein